MMHRNRLLLLCAALALLIWGCGSKKNTPEDAKLSGNSYTNRFFGFGLQIPKTWTFPDKPSRREVRKKTETVLGVDKETADAAAEAADKAHCLLIAKELWSGMSLVVMAENLRDTPEIRTGKEYLEESLEVLIGDGKPFQQVGEPGSVRFANMNFHRVDMTGQVMGRKHHQGMLVAIEKGYALMMLVGAESETGVDEVLTKVGFRISRNRAAEASHRVSNISPRKAATIAPPEPSWVEQIKLQGIGGSGSRRFAIINGKTFAEGDADKVKTQPGSVMVRCVAITETSATITLEGVDGERELQLAGQ